MDWKECRKFIKDEFAENKKKCRDKLRKITKELEPDFKVDGIDAFFKNVGEGLVQAQKSMDSRTVEYLATDPAIPSVFRIPKVNAELSFSLKQGTSGGFLAQLLSGGEDEKTMAHKVNFDIVSVPPPPEVVQQLGVSWLGSFVVTDLITRRRLKKDMDELFAEQERIVKKLKKNSKPTGVEE
ncbi:MAG: hypothetical protein GY859_37230, partial [Desulfobacterales bacterium]|nr:hypothetical protein [Desulfobacterales bacterium]